MTPEELAERFDISLPAARIRFDEIERMRRRRNGTKRPLPASIEEFLRAAQQRGQTVKSLNKKDLA